MDAVTLNLVAGSVKVQRELKLKVNALDNNVVELSDIVNSNEVIDDRLKTVAELDGKPGISDKDVDIHLRNVVLGWQAAKNTPPMPSIELSHGTTIRSPNHFEDEYLLYGRTAGVEKAYILFNTEEGIYIISWDETSKGPENMELALLQNQKITLKDSPDQFAEHLDYILSELNTAKDEMKAHKFQELSFITRAAWNFFGFLPMKEYYDFEKKDLPKLKKVIGYLEELRTYAMLH